MANRDITLQRSGCVEREESYDNDNTKGKKNKKWIAGILKKEAAGGKVGNPEVTGHFCQGRGDRGERSRAQGFLSSPGFAKHGQEGGGRGGAWEEQSSQSSSPLLN